MCLVWATSTNCGKGKNAEATELSQRLKQTFLQAAVFFLEWTQIYLESGIAYGLRAQALETETYDSNPGSFKH